MSAVVVTVTGFDELQRKVNPVRFRLTVSAATFAVGKLFQDRISKYPGPVHRPVIWASDRSRRYYFAMRRKGNMPMQYDRLSDPMSQRLRDSWTVSHLAPYNARVTTKATYATYVQGPFQTEQHKATGWKTVEQAADELTQSGDIEKAAGQIINAAWRTL